MELRTYLDTLPRGDTVKFAEKCRIGAVYLSQLAARLDDRYPSPALCVTIERESGGLVTRQELRPTDWQAIWPELVNSAQAATEPVAPVIAGELPFSRVELVEAINAGVIKDPRQNTRRAADLNRKAIAEAA